jgi:tetratricopeptide (TPR) repeat protein
MAEVKICRLNGPSKEVMNRCERPLRSSSTRRLHGWFFLFLLLATSAFAQGDFEAHLEDAVKAQSAGDIPAAIAAYQSAVAIRQDVPEVWANLGLMQHQAGDAAGALASFKTANKLQPKLFVPVLFLGLENLQLGSRAEAVRYLSMARQLHPNDPEIYMSLGRAYFGLKQFENASLAFRHVTELNKKNGEAWYRLGVTHLEIAEAASGEFASLNRQSPYFQALNAESLNDQGKLVEATDAYRKVLALPGAPPCTRSSLGLVLIRRGEIAEAQIELEKDQKAGGCSLAELGLIRLALARGETEAALKSLGALWRLDPGFLRAHASILTIEMPAEQIGTFDQALAQSNAIDLPSEAIAVLRQSVRGGRTLSVEGYEPENSTVGTTAPQSAQGHYTRGEYGRCTKSLLPAMATLSRDKLSLLATCSFYTGDFQTTLMAAKKLRQAYRAEEIGLYWSIRAEQRLAVLYLVYAGEVEPDSIRLHELLAESYRDRGKYSEAEAEYKVALGINPKEFAALIGAASNYLQESRIDLAAEMIQGALAENPSDPEANYVMGEVLIAKHQYSEAEPYLKTGLGAKAELVPRIHALLGQIYASQGNTERAVEEFKAGLPSDDDGSIHFQLGRLYQKTGESKLAAAAFEESKALIRRKQAAARGLEDRVNQSSPQP